MDISFNIECSNLLPSKFNDEKYLPNHSRFPPEELISFEGYGCLKNNLEKTRSIKITVIVLQFKIILWISEQYPSYSGSYGDYQPPPPPQYGSGYGQGHQVQYGGGKINFFYYLFVKKSNIPMMKIILAEEYISFDGIHNVPCLCQ